MATLTLTSGKVLPEPDTIPDNFWSQDISKLPSVTWRDVQTYLLDSPSDYSKENLKNYKSLKAYEYFTEGHVQDVFFHDIKDSEFCFLKTKLNEPTACTSKLCAWKACRKNVTPSFAINIDFKRRKRDNEPLLPNVPTGDTTPREKHFSSKTSTMPISAEYMKTLHGKAPHLAFFTSHTMDQDDENSGSDTDTGDETEETTLPEPLLSLYDPTSINMDEHTLHVHSQQLYDNYKHSDTTYKNLTSTTIQQALSPIWHIHRGGRITGSTAGQLMATNKDTPSTTFVNTCMQYNKPFKSEHTQYGKTNESTARRKYEQYMKQDHTNLVVRQTGFWIKPDEPFLGASPDGIVECDCHVTRLLEIKCPSKYAKGLVNWQSDSTFPLDANGQIKHKHHFYAQVQLQMYVCQYIACDLFIFSPVGTNIISTILRDDDYITDMIGKATFVFFRTILPEIVSRKNDALEDNERKKWCTCQKRSFGNMIACDGRKCTIQWFHFPCVGVTRNPRGRWYCDQCK